MSGARERGFEALEAELSEERAVALGRAGRRVEAEFARAGRLLQQLDSAVGAAHVELLTHYRTARADFEQALWQFCVQREALGLWDHHRVHGAYPFPPRR